MRPGSWSRSRLRHDSVAVRAQATPDAAPPLRGYVIRAGREITMCGHSSGAVLVVVGARSDGRAGEPHGRAGELGALGTHRSASAGDSSGSGGFTSGGPAGTGPTRPMRTQQPVRTRRPLRARRCFRIALAAAKVLTAFVVAFAAAVGLLFAL